MCYVCDSDNTMKTYKKFIYTTIDKQIFESIAIKYKNVIENKHTDGPTSRAKDVAWGRIANEFNSNPQTSHQVTPKQLRRLWMNLKQREWKKERENRVSSGIEQVDAVCAVIDGSMDSLQPALAQPALFVNVDTSPTDSNSIDRQSVCSPEPAARTSSLSPEDFRQNTTGKRTRSERDDLSEDSDEESPDIKLEAFNSMEVAVDIQRVTQKRTNLKTTDPIQSTKDRGRTLTSHANSSRYSQHRNTEAEDSQFARTTTNQTNQNEILYYKHKIFIMEKEFIAGQKRARELHDIEVMLMRERLREARAKADMAEVLLQQQRTSHLTRE